MQIPAELEIARGLPPSGCPAAEAQRYTRWLATHHYENFNVVSWLLPRRLHQHFYNLYAYCRWADDLGDEIADPVKALELLDGWDQELRDCYALASRQHPVFIALHETITALRYPDATPFHDLLIAFRQDQTVQAWYDDVGCSVLDYCRYSANPVGRLQSSTSAVIAMPRANSFPTRPARPCSLANFWQDVTLRPREGPHLHSTGRTEVVHGLTEDDIVVAPV